MNSTVRSVSLKSSSVGMEHVYQNVRGATDGQTVQMAVMREIVLLLAPQRNSNVTMDVALMQDVAATLGMIVVMEGQMRGTANLS